MNLSWYYKKAVIYPSLLLLFFATVYTIIDNYQSEWSAAGFLISTSIIGTLLYVLLMCILTLTIFLNKYRRLNKYLLWNILTWFLLPIGYISMVLIYDISNRIKYEFGYGDSFIYILIMTAPFLVSLFLTFIKYRQKRTMI